MRGHAALDLITEYFDHPFHTGLPIDREPEQVRSADGASVGLERDGFQHMGAASYAAVDNQGQRVTNRIPDLGELFKRLTAPPPLQAIDAVDERLKLRWIIREPPEKWLEAGRVTRRVG